jgi:hypothetical protein
LIGGVGLRGRGRRPGSPPAAAKSR